jgi:uncharacterized repeat protein (TIGR03803 family)
MKLDVIRWMIGAAVATAALHVPVSRAGGVVHPLDDFANDPGDAGPDGDLVQGVDGRWYGVTSAGGGRFNGSIYVTDLKGHHQTLHAFTYGEGNTPHGPLVATPDGSLYGEAESGGLGPGTLWRLAPDGTLEVLHRFTEDDGDGPRGGLVLGPDGAIWGNTISGGAHGQGTLFELGFDGRFASVASFGGKEDNPSEPEGGLLPLAGGGLLGTSLAGGPGNAGTVWSWSRAEGVRVIASFKKKSGPQMPGGALADGGDGWFYGTTIYGGQGEEGANGTVYRVNAAGTIEDLHDFAADGHEGANPQAPMHRATDGHLYGTTWTGGNGGCGTAFRLDGSGRFQVVHVYAVTEACSPSSGLVEAAPGRLIGAAGGGGPALHGDAYLLTHR